MSAVQAREERLQRSSSRPLTLTLTKISPTPAQIGLITVLGAILVVALAPRLDPDLWWHVKVGAWIVARHAVPDRDTYSFTVYGKPWTDHEWLAEVLLYVLYQMGGVWGPIVFFAGVIGATFSLVYLSMRRLGVSAFLAVFVLAAVAFASSASWGPRIQMLTLFLFALFQYLLLRYRESGNRRILFAFPALMLVWANLHAGFVVGLAVIAIAAVGAWLDQRSARLKSGGRADPAHLVVTGLASFAVTIFNPHGYRLLLYPLTFLMPNAFTNQIQESASPNFHTPVMMLFAALLLGLIATLVVRRPRLSWVSLLTIVAFTWLALSQARNVPLWCVAVGPILAFGIQSTAVRKGESAPRLPSRRRAVANLVLTTAVLGLLAGEGSRFIQPSAVSQAMRDQFPVASVSYLASHRLPRNTLVSYNWSGYFIGRLGPRYRTFLDLRADTVFNNTVLQAYLDTYGAAPDWESTLRRYRVGTILVEHTAPLAQVLRESRHWKLVQSDRLSVVYVAATRRR